MAYTKSLLLAVIGFVILAALDFVPMQFPARMIFPMLWLSMFALYQRQWALTGACFFSFLGDVMGWQNELIPQIAFFALAQITYIILFCLLMPPKKTCSHALKIILLCLLTFVYGLAMNWIFPRVEDNMIAVGIAVYAILLLGMCYTAVQHKNVLLIAGAVLFVISDFTLGIHLFVQRVPHSTMCIMIPYYLGQLLLFIGIQIIQKKRTLQQ